MMGKFIGCGPQSGSRWKRRALRVVFALAALPLFVAVGASAPVTGCADCPDVAGNYSATGSCDSPQVQLPNFVSIVQTDCSLTITSDSGIAMRGTVSGDMFEVSTTDPIPQTCTGTMDGDTFDASCVFPDLGIHCSIAGSAY